MGSRRDPVNGLIAIDQRFADDTYLEAIDGSSTGSDYSQAGSRPGRAAEVDGQSWVPAITGGQGTETIELLVQSSGYAGNGRATYKLDGGTAVGWLGPVACQWFPVAGLWSSSSTYDLHAEVVLPRSQKLVVVYAEQGTGATASRTKTIGTSWSSAATVDSGSQNALTAFVIPRPAESTDRIVVIAVTTADRIRTYYSDDEGVTWALLSGVSDIAKTVPASPTRAVCGVAGGQVAVFFGDPSTNSDWYHYASSDLGISFDQVGGSGVTFTGTLHVRTATTPRGIALVYDDGGGLVMKLLPTAYSEFSTVQPVDVTTTATISSHAVTCDWDGTLYVWEAQPDGTGELSESRDYGLNWTVHPVYASGDASIRPMNTSMVGWRGRLSVLMNHASSGSYNGSLSEMRLSSWSTIEWDANPAITYFPAEVPTGSPGWTQPGATAGTISIVGSLSIVTSSSTGYYRYDAAGHSLAVACHYTMVVTSGGNIGTNDIIASIIGTSASQTYHMRVRFTGTGFRVIDNIGPTTVATVAIDMTAGYEFMMGFSSAGNGFLAYKLPEETEWTYDTDVAGFAFADGGALEANWSYWMGHVASSSASSGWKFVALYDSNIGLVRGANMAGKRITSRPYPLADVVDADGKVGYVSARGGVAIDGETYTIAPEYEYAIGNIFPSLSPSPQRVWRSTDTSEQIIAFDLGDNTWIGAIYSTMMLGTNFNVAVMEYWTGSAWATRGTWLASEGWDFQEYSATGDTLIPNDGTDPSDRYLQGSEAVGALFVADGVGYKVRDNTDGWWHDKATITSRLPRIWLEDPGSIPSSGGFTLSFPRGILIVHPTTNEHRRRWRIRIPSQTVADSYYQIGVLAIGQVSPFDPGWGWGWQQEDEGTYESTTDRHGTELRTNTGPRQRTWSFDFSFGIDETGPRQIVADDYVGVSGGLISAAVMTHRYQMLDFIDRTAGQTIPVIAISAIPTEDITITDQTLWCYGYLSSSVAVTMAQGVDGTDELVRIETIEVRGIR